MRAYLLQPGTTGPKDLKLVERANPKPGPKEILVRMRAASLNYRDLRIATDQYPLGKLSVDTIPLSDGAGEVIEVGPGVTRFKVGDRVAGTFAKGWISGPSEDGVPPALGQSGVDGILAEQVVIDQQDAVKLPDGLSFEEGACLPCAAVTAWNSLVVRWRHEMRPIGFDARHRRRSVFAIQFAKAAGCLSIATSSSDAKLAKAKALGADVLINYKTNPTTKRPSAKRPAGAGVDHIVEIGGVGTLERSYKSLANNGTIGLIGFLAGADKNPNIGIGRGAKIARINVGSRRSFEDMNRAITVNKIKPVIDKVFPFEQAPAAYEYETSGAHFGKIVRYDLTGRVFGDIFRPERGLFADETRHQSQAVGVFCNDDLDAAAAQKRRIAGEIGDIADHHARDGELNDRARTHQAGRQRRIERHAFVIRPPPRFAQAIHFAMRDRIAAWTR